MNKKTQVPNKSSDIHPDSFRDNIHDSSQDDAHDNISVVNIHNPTFTTAEDVKHWIKAQAKLLGFADCGFLSVHHPLFQQQIEPLQRWLDKGYEGQLQFMRNNHELRAHPEQLVAGAKTIISVRMDYLTQTPKPRSVTDNDLPNNAIIARYARGRDYHKTMRGRLKQLALKIEEMLPEWQQLNIGAKTDFVFRPFSDSAPIFERPIADAVGLGWTGKHTLLLNKQAGSFFVLGELFTSLELPDDEPVAAHCGSCSACIDICPTQAIVAPYELNAAACISYLTIEHKGSIDTKYRRAIGNRVFGCDDCQLICPWNRYARITSVEDFAPRHKLDDISLLELWQWKESDFLNNTQGSPLRRTGYVSFLRNIAIGLGNANASFEVIAQLQSKLGLHSAMLDEHINWALAEQREKLKTANL
ncbi:tRNA epoxyqueuosine(34) reductase QueG [Psychrobacter sp. H8-1]|uniref:tRNA epoxyqueuosine(34) reductase QueG n=1 Tax=Psychrobacter sp. H8-1 TaxID=2774129 RepID=UPI0019181376|nr:tRNA epoxyqueuosine(34) reductase QueG [Psychrobacter sp. H8-1]